MEHPTPEPAPAPVAGVAVPFAPAPAAVASPTPARRVRVWPAIAALFVLAALIPESIITFNTPPVAYLTSPVNIFFLPAFYGSANLLIRELLRRRPLGWAGMLVLGAAFGCVNEGIIAGTWYHVVPTGYVLLAGVNWGWAVALTLFHVVYSVAVPIFLVEAIFPRLAGRPWLRRRGIIICCVLLGLCITLGVLTPTYRGYRVAVLLVVALLSVVGFQLRAQPGARQPATRRAPGVWWLRLAGFGGTVLYFASIYLVPAVVGHFATTPPTLAAAQALDIAVMLGVFALGASVVRGWTRRAGWGTRQALALVAGTFVLTTGLSLVLPQPRAEGEPLFTLPFGALLIWLAWRDWRRDIKGLSPN